MPHISLRWLAVLSALGACIAVPPADAATRPRYGGVLRVEIRQSIETADPPQDGPGMADLAGSFSIARWEAGHSASYAAEEYAPGGRPFLDAVEIVMGRPLRDQAADLELGRADIVELGWNEVRRAPAGRRVWASSPVRVVALVFGSRVEDERIREALAMAVNRVAIHNVLLQGQGEISGALLPQWISGYAFLFDRTADVKRARELVSTEPLGARSFSLGVEDAALRPVADRIALNARDAGLAISVVQGASADVRLTEARVVSRDPAKALTALAASFGLPAPAHTDTPDALFAAERTLLDGFRVVPLFHLPVLYGVSPRVRGGTGITPLGEWRFENLWLQGARP